jgi:hypothetical protein
MLTFKFILLLKNIVSLSFKYGDSIAVVSTFLRYGRSMLAVSADVMAEPAAPVMSAHLAPALSHTKNLLRCTEKIRRPLRLFADTTAVSTTIGGIMPLTAP